MLNIDSQVQQRMDQFRGRPQDLMQQYQMSRELIDLLALQKLKSEKDAAARSMMMQMQQNPQTIAAQREAELMGRTQHEVAQQVGGIAQLAEARKQQNLQRMASGQQPPVKMAGGGIARFQEGGNIEAQRARDIAGELFGAVPTVAAPTIQMPTEQIERQRAAAAALEEAVAGMDPEAARTRAAETLRREEIRNAAMQRAEGLQALYERQRDPALLAKERRSAFLRGLSGGSSLGYAGGAAGLAAERARQRAQERQDLEELNRLRTAIDTADIGIGRDILSAGDTAMQELGAARRQGLQSATGELQSALRVNSEQARNILNAAVQNAQVESDRAKEAADIYRDSVEAGRKDFTAALGVVDEYQSLVTQLFDSLVNVRGAQVGQLTVEEQETLRKQAELLAQAQMNMGEEQISRLIQQTRAYQLAPMIERDISGATIEQ